jgi:hypothetical protein
MGDTGEPRVVGPDWSPVPTAPSCRVASDRSTRRGAAGAASARKRAEEETPPQGSAGARYQGRSKSCRGRLGVAWHRRQGCRSRRDLRQGPPDRKQGRPERCAHHPSCTAFQCCVNFVAARFRLEPPGRPCLRYFPVAPPLSPQGRWADHSAGPSCRSGRRDSTWCYVLCSPMAEQPRSIVGRMSCQLSVSLPSGLRLERGQGPLTVLSVSRD